MSCLLNQHCGPPIKTASCGAADDAIRQKVLATNPERLYGFGPLGNA